MAIYKGGQGLQLVITENTSSTGAGQDLMERKISENPEKDLLKQRR